MTGKIKEHWKKKTFDKWNWPKKAKQRAIRKWNWVKSIDKKKPSKKQSWTEKKNINKKKPPISKADQKTIYKAKLTKKKEKKSYLKNKAD